MSPEMSGMSRVALLLTFLFLAPFGYAQTNKSASIPGLKLGKVPEVLYSQVPNIPSGKGLLVLRVEPDSPAARVGLAQYDILLSLGGKSLKDVDQFYRLAASGLQVPQMNLRLVRGGKELNLHISTKTLASSDSSPTAILKPGGLPAVTVEAKPLEGNRMSVTFKYYAEGSKLKRVECTGSLDEIKKQVLEQGMPPRVQDLADVAIERLRAINSSTQKK
jgi:hypothetical protein